MTPSQYNELQRQATVTKTRVQRVIELQQQLNNQIDEYGYAADETIAEELDRLMDQLTNREISILTTLMYEDTVSNTEYEDNDQITE